MSRVLNGVKTGRSISGRGGSWKIHSRQGGSGFTRAASDFVPQVTGSIKFISRSSRLAEFLEPSATRIQHSSVATLISETERAILESLYIIEEENTFFAMLSRNRFLASILIELYKELNHFFVNALFVVRVMNDPDSDIGDEVLILVQSGAPMSELMTILDEFDNAWWIPNLKSVRGKLTVDINSYA
jgi:hypothetical protein